MSDEKFIVDDDNKANWTLRKIKKIKKKQEENKELAEQQIYEIQKEIHEIEQWRDSENDKLESDVEYFESLLQNYATKLKEENPELKTHKLPFGKLQFRKKPDKWRYDDSKLLESVKKMELQDVIKIKESVNKNKLKKSSKVVEGKVINPDTGEVIEGVVIESVPEQFEVKVNN